MRKFNANKINTASVVISLAVLILLNSCGVTSNDVSTSFVQEKTESEISDIQGYPAEPYRKSVSVSESYVMSENEKEVLNYLSLENNKIIFKENKYEYNIPYYYDGESIIFGRYKEDDNSTTVYKFSFSSQKVKQLGEPFFFSGYRHESVRDNIFIIGATVKEDSPGEWSRNCVLLKIDPFNETITKIKEYESFWLPIMYASNEYVLVNIHETEGNSVISRIEYYNVKSEDCRILIEERAVYNEDDTLTGKDVYVCGGDNENVYYQVLELDNMVVAEAKNTKIMRLSLSENSSATEHIYTSEYSVQYIDGHSNVLLINDYAYEEPLEDVAKVIIFDEDTEKGYSTLVIEGIRTTSDIQFSKFINGEILIVANESAVFVINIKTREIKREEIANTAGSLIANGNQVYFFQYMPELQNQNNQKGAAEMVYNEYTLGSMTV